LRFGFRVWVTGSGVQGIGLLVLGLDFKFRAQNLGRELRLIALGFWCQIWVRGLKLWALGVKFGLRVYSFGLWV
jgi:hypothetical protein